MLLLALLAAAAPQPGALRTFADWTVGCDNVRSCQAVALLPEAGGDGHVTMSLRRDAGADADTVVSFRGEAARGGALVADGRRLPVRLIATGDNVIVHPADAAALVAALRSARALRLVDAGGTALGAVSLAGAPAALDYMDEAQAGAVAAPLPEVRLAPPAQDLAPEFAPERIAALREEVGCTIGEVGGPDQHDAIQIADGTTLVLLACGTGAYNLGTVPLIARAGSGAIAAAPFDVDDVIDDGLPRLVNAAWDDGRRLLTTHSLARGIGDCGTRADYGWDGTRFRLVRQAEMGECRGATDYIIVWRARVLP